MKVGPVKLSAASCAVLVIQLGLVCSIAGKYLYQRWRCPRVWTRTVAYDPDLLMRGRYLGLQLMVDGCESTLPSAKQARYPRDVNGVPKGTIYSVDLPSTIVFNADLAVRNNKLVAIQVPENQDARSSQAVFALPGVSCDQMQLSAPVSFYIPEHAQSPLPIARGAELWIEVTVPRKGPPRPLQLALKQNGAWQPLALH